MDTRALIKRCNRLELSRSQVRELVMLLQTEGWVTDAAATAARLLAGDTRRGIRLREIQDRLCSACDNCLIDIMRPLFGLSSPGEPVSLLSLGYMGDAIEIHKCITRLATEGPQPMDPVLRMVLDPAVEVKQQYPVLQPVATPHCNATQLAVVLGLRFAVEVTQANTDTASLLGAPSPF